VTVKVTVDIKAMRDAGRLTKMKKSQWSRCGRLYTKWVKSLSTARSAGVLDAAQYNAFIA